MRPMRLERVTFTGADDSVDPVKLAELSAQYPFVEWGILFSKRQQGLPRYPSIRWMRNLLAVHDIETMPLAAHLCGRWLRDALAGYPTWEDTFGDIVKSFARIQLNFHAFPHEAEPNFRDALPAHASLIYQVDGVNDAWVKTLIMAHGGSPLFDLSGGAGLVPDYWPDAWPGVYCGYAGGLGPDSVTSELHMIAEAAHLQPFWIDMERRVRSTDDKQFDLDKVRRVLDLVAPLVVPRSTSTV